MTILVITSGPLLEQRLSSAQQRKPVGPGSAAQPIKVLPFLNERRASLLKSSCLISAYYVYKTNDNAKILDRRAQVRFTHNQNQSRFYKEIM